MSYYTQKLIERIKTGEPIPSEDNIRLKFRTYAKFQPSSFDSAQNFIAFDGETIDKVRDWLVAPMGVNRDSDCMTRTNYDVQLEVLRAVAEENEDFEELDCGHWACGWYKIVVCRPGSPAELAARVIQLEYDNYPSLDDDRNSDAEQEEANEVWKGCYSDSERIDYIRRYRSQFEFQSFADMLGCVRGKYFAGYASELIYR